MQQRDNLTLQNCADSKTSINCYISDSFVHPDYNSIFFKNEEDETREYPHNVYLVSPF